MAFNKRCMKAVGVRKLRTVVPVVKIVMSEK